MLIFNRIKWEKISNNDDEKNLLHMFKTLTHRERERKRGDEEYENFNLT